MDLIKYFFLTLRNKFQHVYIKQTIQCHLFDFSVKCNCSWEGKGVVSRTHVIFASFEFQSVIWFSFCSFWISSIFLWWFEVVLRLEDYSTFSSFLIWWSSLLFFEKLVLGEKFFFWIINGKNGNKRTNVKLQYTRK